jgi:hypothetical protein
MRRADPERLYQAKLASLRARILGEWRQTEAAADALLAEWDREASTRGLTGWSRPTGTRRLGGSGSGHEGLEPDPQKGVLLADAMTVALC